MCAWVTLTPLVAHGSGVALTLLLRLALVVPAISFAGCSRSCRPGLDGGYKAPTAIMPVCAKGPEARLLHRLWTRVHAARPEKSQQYHVVPRYQPEMTLAEFIREGSAQTGETR